MRFATWSIEKWLEYSQRALVPADFIKEELGRAYGAGFVDSAAVDRGRNSVADRCELVSGLVYSAEVHGWIGTHQCLVVVGSGPTAIIACTLAATRGIKVIQICVEDTTAMRPLSDCYDRWIAPNFFDSAEGSRTPPTEFNLPASFSECGIEDIILAYCCVLGKNAIAQVLPFGGLIYSERCRSYLGMIYRDGRRGISLVYQLHKRKELLRALSDAIRSDSVEGIQLTDFDDWLLCLQDRGEEFQDSTHGWTWATPAAFAALANRPDQTMRDYYYGHEPASTVASRWIRTAEHLTLGLEDMWTKHVVTRADLEVRGLQALDDVARNAIGLGPLEEGVGLVLHCQMFANENTTLSAAGVAINYESVPYWETGFKCSWLSMHGRMVVSGSGDGALQDFLRGVWGWTTLDDCSRDLQQLFAIPEDFSPEGNDLLAGTIAELNLAQNDMYGCSEAIDDRRVLYQNTGLAPKSEFVAWSKDELERAETSFFETIEQCVNRVLAYCKSLDQLHGGIKEFGEIHLHTRKRRFGRCYSHNAFFALLTIKLIENAGRNVWHCEPDGPSIVYQGAMDLSIPEAFKDALAQAELKICGVPEVQVLLLRYGIVKYEFMESWGSGLR